MFGWTHFTSVLQIKQRTSSLSTTEILWGSKPRRHHRIDSTGSRKQRKWRMPCTSQAPARACNHGKNRLIIFRAVTLRIMIVLSIALWSNASLAYCSGVVTYTLLMLYNHRCRYAGIWTFCTLNTSKRTVPSAARTQSRATLIYKQQTSRGIDYRRSYANLVRLVTNHIGP